MSIQLKGQMDVSFFTKISISINWKRYKESVGDALTIIHNIVTVTRAKVVCALLPPIHTMVISTITESIDDRVQLRLAPNQFGVNLDDK